MCFVFQKRVFYKYVKTKSWALSRCEFEISPYVSECQGNKGLYSNNISVVILKEALHQIVKIIMNSGILTANYTIIHNDKIH